MKTNDFKTIIHYYLKNWRMLLAVLLCTCVVAGVLTVGNAMSEDKTATQSGQNTEIDMHAVKVAYFHWNAVEKQRNVVENALYMQIDSHHVNEKVLTYTVAGSDEQARTEIIERCQGIVYDGTLLAGLQEVCPEYTIDNLADIICVNELEENTIVRVKICSYSQESVEKFASVVKEYLQVNAQIELNEEVFIIERDAELEEKQIDYYEYMKNCKVLSDNYYTLLLPEEKAYLERLKSGEVSVSEMYGETADTEDSAEEGADALKTTVSLTSLFKSMINAIVIGVFVYIVIVYIKFVTNTRLQTSEEVEELFDVKVIGRAIAGTKRRFGKVLDCVIAKAMSGELDAEFERAKLNRFFHSQQGKYEKMIVIGDTEEVSLFAEGQAQLSGVEVVTDYMNCKEFIEDVGCKLAVVIAVKVGSTKYAEITRQIKACEEFQADVVGAIVLEER